MNLAILRVSGSDDELKILSNSLSLPIDSSWKRGDEAALSRKLQSSGFQICIADADTPSDMLKEIRDFLVKCEPHESIFKDTNLTVQLDLGIGVGYSEQFTANVTFTPKELIHLGKLGIELTISAYPTSDENE